MASRKAAVPKEEIVSTAVLDDTESRVVVTPSDLSADGFIFDGVSDARLMEEGPLFSVGEVAKMFFARSADWMRWRESHNFFTLDGQPVGTLRTTPPPAPKSRNGQVSKATRSARSKTQAGQRRYTLADIEKIAHGLAEKGAITSQQLLATLRLVDQVGRLYGLIGTAA